MFQSLFQIDQGRITLLSCMMVCSGWAAVGQADEWQFHRRTSPHMGTKWHIALYSRDIESANAAFDRAFAIIAEIDADLTNYGSESELNRLCRGAPHATPVSVGKHLWTVLQAANAMSFRTNGAFDVTIGPLSKLWRRARQRKTLPDSDRLDAARQSVGFELIQYDEPARAIQLTRDGMQLDLGGIAKGYAVDQAIHVLAECGIRRALVNGGGDLRAADPPPNESGWLVKVARLDPQDEPASMSLANQAIATSGDAFQFVEIDGRRYSHIIDPKTAKGTPHRSSVSVIATTCMQADAWASALTVLPPQRGMELIENEKGVEAMQLSLSGDETVRLKTERFPTLH